MKRLLDLNSPHEWRLYHSHTTRKGWDVYYIAGPGAGCSLIIVHTLKYRDGQFKATEAYAHMCMFRKRELEQIKGYLMNQDA